jgi:hypothetical protein
MLDKKPVVHKTPDLTKLQAVVIDNRTTLYIPIGADPKEATKRYSGRLDVKKT